MYTVIHIFHKITDLEYTPRVLGLSLQAYMDIRPTDLEENMSLAHNVYLRQ